MTADLRTRVAALESRWLHAADAYDQLAGDWQRIGKEAPARENARSAYLFRSHAAELRDLLEATS